MSERAEAAARPASDFVRVGKFSMRLHGEPLRATFVPRFLFSPDPELFYKDLCCKEFPKTFQLLGIRRPKTNTIIRMRFSRVVAASLICTSFSICTNAFISCSPFAAMHKMNSGRQFVSKDSMFVGLRTSFNNKLNSARAMAFSNLKISAALTSQSFSFNEFSHTLLSFEKNSLDYLRNSAKGKYCYL